MSRKCPRVSAVGSSCEFMICMFLCAITQRTRELPSFFNSSWIDDCTCTSGMNPQQVPMTPYIIYMHMHVTMPLFFFSLFVCLVCSKYLSKYIVRCSRVCRSAWLALTRRAHSSSRQLADKWNGDDQVPNGSHVDAARRRQLAQARYGLSMRRRASREID